MKPGEFIVKRVQMKAAINGRRCVGQILQTLPHFPCHINLPPFI